MGALQTSARDAGLVCKRSGGGNAVEPYLVEHFVLVHMPLSGSARLVHPDGERTLSMDLAGITSPHSPFRVVWNEDCEQLIVRIDIDRVEQVGRGIVGASYHAPIVFDPEMDLQTHGGQAWRHLVNYARTSIATGPTSKSPAGRHTLEDLLIAHLLVHHRHNYTDALLSALPSHQAQ